MKEKVLNWIQQFDTFSFLDNHNYHIEPHSIECLAAAGVVSRFNGTLNDLRDFVTARPDKWLFGHLGYDLKNELEALSSRHADHVGFPDIAFFEPAVIIHFNPGSLTIECEDPAKVFSELQETASERAEPSRGSIKIQQRISREEYIGIINRLKEHILRGDCYEINFCQEFFAKTDIQPLEVYKKLSEISPNPFSCLYRLEDKWLICASPERFLKKQGNKILSQPIKGTAKRVIADSALDEKSKNALYESGKDRSENVMIVDLVRNDLSKVCVDGSVQVEELFGIYSFPQVHQMISTITGDLTDGMDFPDIIAATFPMGSMTGAPKKRVMELIEQYERSKRGIFSGAVGYLAPNGDFDLNVVIRSIMYNETNRYLSFQTGSAITFYSDPGEEWEECMLKAEAMKQCF